MEDWQCCLCLDLCYKPTVNGCGHVFCYLCLHNSFDEFGSTKCALCRSKQTHFPQVCGQLHLFLQKSWPEEYAARAAEVAADDSLGACTPHVAAEQHRWHISKQATWADRVRRSISSDQKFLEYDFLCSHPRCRRLLLHPLVLNCGHTVCAGTCSPFSGEGPYECPRCHALLTVQVAVCKQFEALLLQLFPVRIQSRIEEVAALPAPGDCGAPAVAPADADSAAKTQLAPFNLVLVRHGPILIVRRSTGGRHPLSAQEQEAVAQSAAGQHRHHVERSRRRRRGGRREMERAQRPAAAGAAVGVRPLVQGRLSGIAEGSAGAAAGNTTAQHRAHLVSALREGFVHPSVCCDACGLCPIKGRRYKCTSCWGPARYDLCGVCHDAGRHGAGRFNQPHHPGHDMVLMKASPHVLHILQALNPEMSIESLTNMMTYQFVGSGRRQLHALREDSPGSRGMGITISMPPEDDASSDSDARSDSDDEDYLSMDLVQEEALARYEQFMRPEGMEAILSDDGTLPLGALAALPGGGLHQRSLNLRRSSRGQAPRVRVVDYGPSRPRLAIPASETDGDALSEGHPPEEEVSEGGGEALPSVQALFPSEEAEVPQEGLHQVDEAAAAPAAGVGRGLRQEALEAFLEGPYSATMDAYAVAEATGDPAVLSAAEGACAEVQAELASMLAGEADSPDLEVEARWQAAGDAPETPASAAERATERSESRTAGTADSGRGFGPAQGLPAAGAAAERVATVAGEVRQALPEWAAQTMRDVQDIQSGLETLQQQLAAQSTAQGPPEQLRLPPAAAASDGRHGTAAASAGPAAASSSTAAAANAPPGRPDAATAPIRYARDTDELGAAARAATQQMNADHSSQSASARVRSIVRAQVRSLVAAIEGRAPLPPPADQPAITSAGLPGSAAVTGISQQPVPAPQRAQGSHRQQQPPEPIVRWPPGNRQSRVLVLPRNQVGSGRRQAGGHQQEGHPAAAHLEASQPAGERRGPASPRRLLRPAAAAAGAVPPQTAVGAAAGSVREGSPHRRRRPAAAAAAAAGAGSILSEQDGTGAAAAARAGGSPRRRRRRAAAAAADAAAGEASLAGGSIGAAAATDQLPDVPSPFWRPPEHFFAAAAPADASLEQGEEGGAVGSEQSEREGQLAPGRRRRVSLISTEPGAVAEAGDGAQGADSAAHAADADRHRWQLPPSEHGARAAGSHRERRQPRSARAGNADEGPPHLNALETDSWQSAAEHDTAEMRYRAHLGEHEDLFQDFEWGTGRAYSGWAPSPRASHIWAELESAREALLAVDRQNAVTLQQLSASRAPSDVSQSRRPPSASQPSASRPVPTQAHAPRVQGAAAHPASDAPAPTPAAGGRRALEDLAAQLTAPHPVAPAAPGSLQPIAAVRVDYAGLQRPGTSMGPRNAAAQQPRAARSAHVGSTARDAAAQAGAIPSAAGVTGNTAAGAPLGQRSIRHRGEQPHSLAPAAARAALPSLFDEAGPPSGQPGRGDRGEGPRSPSPAAAREAALSPAQQEAAWVRAASGTLPAVVVHFGPGSMTFHIPEELVYLASDLDEACDLGDSSDDDESGLGGDVSTTMLLLLCHALTRQRMPTA